MPGPKTNEREGTRAVLRHAGMSAYKVREVLDAVRGRPVYEAADLLNFVERDCAQVIGKLLHSAVANAQNNDGLDPDELYVSACYADEGPTAKRWRPRARGRATRIRKRSSHITVIVSRMPDAQLARLQARRRQENLTMRSRRVEATRRSRTELAEGSSRRERRHPEAFTAPEDETGETTTPELEATSVTEATQDEGTEDEGTEGTTAQDEGAEVEEPETEVVTTPEVEAIAEAAEDGQAPGTGAGEQEKDS
jgi:large subunit ribosomal protein L22